MFIRNRTTSSSPSSSIRIIYIGNEQQPINLAEMVSVNSHSWKKAACFSNLVDSVDSVANSHNVADIVAILELPFRKPNPLLSLLSSPSYTHHFWTQLHSLLQLETKLNLVTLRSSHLASPTLHTSVFVVPCMVPPLTIE